MMMQNRENVKILIVDDALFMRAVLKDILVSIGYTKLFEAQDGLVAVEKFKTINPDLVTMDINMPNMNGLQALKAIMNINRKAKVIMVTSVEQRYTVQEALKLGAKDYIVKPFERSMVGMVIDRVIRMS
ncbi:MAG: response regulator [Candidatus Nitrosocaldaceae archaeon]